MQANLKESPEEARSNWSLPWEHIICPNILRPVEAGPLLVTLIDVLFIQGLSFLSSSDLDWEANTPQRRVLIVEMQWSELKVNAQSCPTLWPLGL